MTIRISHCLASGHYAYIETSSPRKPNDTANLISPKLDQPKGVGCLIFWYHMYGADINSLAVLKRVSDILKYSREYKENSFARLATISKLWNKHCYRPSSFTITFNFVS